MTIGRLAVSDHLFQVMLRLYPQRFRARYGDEMAQVFRDCCRQAMARPGGLRLVRLWMHTCFDLAVAAAQEHMQDGESIAMDKFFVALQSVLRKFLKVAMITALLVVVILGVWVIRGKVIF